MKWWKAAIERLKAESYAALYSLSQDEMKKKFEYNKFFPCEFTQLFGLIQF